MHVAIIEPEKYRRLMEWMLSEDKTIGDIAMKVWVKKIEVERVLKLLRIK